MRAQVIQMRRAATKLQCSKCGATADAQCGCGVSYLPAGSRAAAAVAADPGKSNRALADDLGVSRETVRRARKSTGTNVPVGKRKGKDGKTRRMPVRAAAPVSDPVKEINAFHREVVGFVHDFTQRFTAWHDAGPTINADGMAALLQAFNLCADGFIELQQKLEGR